MTNPIRCIISTGRILPHPPGSKGRIQEFFLQMEMPVAQRTRLVADKLADVFEPKNSEKSLGGCAITIAIARRGAAGRLAFSAL
jgi:hypothetical protein